MGEKDLAPARGRRAQVRVERLGPAEAAGSPAPGWAAVALAAVQVRVDPTASQASASAGDW